MKQRIKFRPIATFACHFGRIEFATASPGHQVMWQRRGSTDYRRVGWIDTDAQGRKTKPSNQLARFFMRKAVAEDEGKTPYFYCDQNIDPTLTK